MGGHTPGHWHIDRRRDNIVVRGGCTECVAAIPTPAIDGHGVTNFAEREANARRICLAVNACATLSDAALESDVIAMVREALALVSKGLYGGHIDDAILSQGGKLVPISEIVNAALALLATEGDDKS